MTIDFTTTNNSSVVFVPEQSSQLYLLSSDILGTSLVHVPFSSNGFAGWRRNLVVSLSARNKIIFIDGSYPNPSEG